MSQQEPFLILQDQSQDEDGNSSVRSSDVMSFTEFEVTPHDLGHVDFQGIPWRLSELSRDQFRRSRLEEYADFEKRKNVRIKSKPHGLQQPNQTQFYSFRMLNRMDGCTINHFQLRHLLSVPSNRGVYFPHLNRVRRWDPTIGKSDVAVELHEALLPRISTCLVLERHILVGGIGGELILVKPGSTKARYFCLVSQDTDNIITHISAIPGKSSVLVSSNDSIVRRYYLEGLRLEQSFRMDWSVNAAAASPTMDDLMCVVGDNPDAILIDMKSGKQVQRLQGHVDFSFDCAWSPDGRWLGTGNQDHTTRIYDCRFLRSAFTELHSEMAAVRCLQFSSDSQYLAVMEADDFVHLYDSFTDFGTRQTIDFFGEAAGLGFTPDTEHLYIGIAGMERGGIFEFKKDHSSVSKRWRSLLL